MKKLVVLSLVAVMSLMSFAPALARENENGKGKEKQIAVEIKKELKQEVKEEKKETKNEIKDLEKSLRYAPKALTLLGKLVSVNSATSSSSTEITVNITKVLPGRPKKMPTSSVVYPEAGKNVVLKITDKSWLIKAYGAKMTVADMAIGDELRIVAKFNKDGSLEARVIKDNSLHMLLSKKGVIESIDTASLSFVFKQGNRTLTVKTDANTKFNMKNGTSTSFADLKVGDKVKVYGTLNSNTKTVVARSVTIEKRPVVVPPPTVSTSTTST